LCLTGTGVTDVGLQYVTGLTRLEELDLSYTKVTDAGFDNFRELTRLKELWLHDTQVTDAGVAELQKALPNVKILR
jgi:hypothetical protein